MNMTRDRVRSIVWTIVVVISAALLAALTFRVNAVKSRVRLTERQIVAIQQEKQSLDTEFQTRANQQQLTAMNTVEFGLKAPTAAQYISGERQLAALSTPVPPAFAPGTQAPVRMAMADVPANVPANVPAKAAVVDHTPVVPAGVAPNRVAPRAGLAERTSGTVRTASASQTVSAVRVASATGSLPRVLGPMANRGRTVGAGTRLLSDRDEVRVKPAKHAALAQAERPELPAAPTRDAAPRRPLPAHLAVQDSAARKRASASVAIKDAAPKKSSVGKPAARQLAQARPSDAGPANLLPAKWATASVPTRAAAKHPKPERLALGDDAERPAARSPKR